MRTPGRVYKARSLKPLQLLDSAPKKIPESAQKFFKKRLHWKTRSYILKQLAKGEEAGSYRAKGEFPRSKSSHDEGEGIRLVFAV